MKPTLVFPRVPERKTKAIPRREPRRRFRRPREFAVLEYTIRAKGKPDRTMVNTARGWEEWRP